MTSHFKKLASASAIAVALAGTTAPAGAAVLGGAAEALLVPLAVWSGGSFNDPDCKADIWDEDCDLSLGYTPAVDTLIELWIPGSVGFDAVPNIFTAQHTTPTNVPTALTPADPDLNEEGTGNSAIHWYWFNRRSEHLANGRIPVTPNDVVQLSWTEMANGQYEDEPGYIVIGNESARSGGTAVFSMFGNAWITGAIHFDPPDERDPWWSRSGIGFPLIGGTIPVLGMNDGADGADVPGTDCAQPTAQDSVKYNAQAPCAVSPVVAGFRTNRSDGVGDLFAFDLALSNREVPTIHVIWFDQNLNDAPYINAHYPGNTATPSDSASVEVFDTDEVACSTSIHLPDELNVIWIPPAFETNEDTLYPKNQPFSWTTINDLLCVATDETNGWALWNSGFVQYVMNEYIDTDVNRAESAAIGFSIKVDGGWVSNDADPIPEALVLMLETSLGHDLGTFRK